MKCPTKGCKGRLRVTHSYAAGNSGTTQRLECGRCGLFATSVTFIAAESPGRGMGAFSLATKIELYGIRTVARLAASVFDKTKSPSETKT